MIQFVRFLVLIAYTQSHDLNMHTQLQSGAR